MAITVALLLAVTLGSNTSYFPEELQTPFSGFGDAGWMAYKIAFDIVACTVQKKKVQAYKHIFFTRIDKLVVVLRVSP